MQKYYFITVMEKIEKDPRYMCNTGFTRCWGFYSNKQDALNVLHENRTDLWETCYDYAVLEEYYEGIGNSTGKRQFFKYNLEKNGYFEIEEPECIKNLIDFAIG